MPACPKLDPVRDAAYTRSAQHRHCMVRDMNTGDFCNGGGVVCAHINLPGRFGRSMKAGDDESLFLCFTHHQQFDGPGKWEWLARYIVVPERKQAYRATKMGTGRWKP